MALTRQLHAFAIKKVIIFSITQTDRKRKPRSIRC